MFYKIIFGKGLTEEGKSRIDSEYLKVFSLGNECILFVKKYKVSIILTNR